MKLPKFLKTVLWSYDISKFDLKNEKDKRLIITQVLNYGDLRDIKWLLSIYPLSELKKTLKNPQRGVWYKRRLNYWLKMLSVNLEKDKYGTALLTLDPFKKRQ